MLQWQLRRHIRALKYAFDNKVADPILDRQSIFLELLKSDLPPEEKSEARLGSEATALIGAGGETTAWGMSCSRLYYRILLTKRP